MKLSGRHLQILPLLAEGMTNEEIGKRLFVSATTVHTHVGIMLVRSGARNRTHLVAIAFREGWLK